MPEKPKRKAATKKPPAKKKETPAPEEPKKSEVEESPVQEPAPSEPAADLSDEARTDEAAAEPEEDGAAAAEEAMADTEEPEDGSVPLDASLRRGDGKPPDARVEDPAQAEEPKPGMIGDTYPGSETQGTVPGEPKQSTDPRFSGGDSPQRVNELGLSVDPDKDDCFHLNPTWRGGVCTVNGNAPCAFLGGSQLKCEYYIDRESEVKRRRGLSDREGRAMTVAEPKK